jgi:hypothetical protein
MAVRCPAADSAGGNQKTILRQATHRRLIGLESRSCHAVEKTSLDVTHFDVLPLKVEGPRASRGYIPKAMEKSFSGKIHPFQQVTRKSATTRTWQRFLTVS